LRNIQSNCLSLELYAIICGFIKMCNSAATKFSFLTAFLTYKEFLLGGASSVRTAILFPLPILRYISTFVSKLFVRWHSQIHWQYKCPFLSIVFVVFTQEILFLEDNHWFSVPPKSKRLLVVSISNTYRYLLCLRSNACAQSLSALCLIIILMLLHICRILCEFFCTLRCLPSMLQRGGRRWKDTQPCVVMLSLFVSVSLC